MKTTKNVKGANTVKSTKGATTAKTSKTTTTAKAETKSAKISGMIATLKVALPKITDKKLKAEVENSLKVAKTATADDLALLIKRVVDNGKVVVANEVKKPAVKKPTAKTEVSKTTTKKSEEKKAPAVTSVPSTGNKRPPFAISFPETTTIEVEGKPVKLKKVGDDEFTSFKELKDAVDNGEMPYICGYWSQRHIKEYAYKESFNVKKCPNSFPDDLDTLQGLYLSEMNEKYYATSIYTDALYVFYPEELKPITDKNPYTGEKFTIRVSNGMEYAIYVEDKTAPAKKSVKKTK